MAALTPHDGMLADLRRDYEAMTGMVFVPVPNVDGVVAAIAEQERRINPYNEPLRWLMGDALREQTAGPASSHFL